MHVPDHLIDPQLELLAPPARHSRSPRSQSMPAADRTERTGRVPRSCAPRAGRPQAATAALVFALQMVNVPVLSGTSGHLLGGALATA